MEHLKSTKFTNKFPNISLLTLIWGHFSLARLFAASMILFLTRNCFIFSPAIRLKVAGRVEVTAHHGWGIGHTWHVRCRFHIAACTGSEGHLWIRISFKLWSFFFWGGGGVGIFLKWCMAQCHVKQTALHAACYMHHSMKACSSFIFGISSHVRSSRTWSIEASFEICSAEKTNYYFIYRLTAIARTASLPITGTSAAAICKSTTNYKCVLFKKSSHVKAWVRLKMASCSCWLPGSSLEQPELL